MIIDALVFKYGVDGLSVSAEYLDGKWVLKEWRHPAGIPKPTEEQIAIAVSEFEIKLGSEIVIKKNKHSEDLALMGWDKQKLKAVKRLINSDDE